MGETMRMYAGATTERLVMEKYNDDDAECHSCGEVGRPRTLIHFAHLCQHFVALCSRCLSKLRMVLKDAE